MDSQCSENEITKAEIQQWVFEWEEKQIPKEGNRTILFTKLWTELFQMYSAVCNGFEQVDASSAQAKAIQQLFDNWYFLIFF